MSEPTRSFAEEAKELAERTCRRNFAASVKAMQDDLRELAQRIPPEQTHALVGCTVSAMLDAIMPGRSV